MSEQSCEAVVGAQHPSLAGHFPGRPIVPGVVILERVVEAVRGDRPLRLAGVPNLKFVHALLPDESFRITWTEDGERCRFRCDRFDVLLAQGVLLFKNDLK